MKVTLDGYEVPLDLVSFKRTDAFDRLIEKAMADTQRILFAPRPPLEGTFINELNAPAKPASLDGIKQMLDALKIPPMPLYLTPRPREPIPPPPEGLVPIEVLDDSLARLAKYDGLYLQWLRFPIARVRVVLWTGSRSGTTQASVEVKARVRDRDDGGPTLLAFNYRADLQSDDRKALALVARDAIAALLIHELDECLYVADELADRRRIFDPHLAEYRQPFPSPTPQR